MKIKSSLLFRRSGMLCAKVSITGGSCDRIPTFEAFASGKSIPVMTFPYDSNTEKSKANTAENVIAIPFLSAPDVKLVARNAKNEISSLNINFNVAKILSPVNHRVRAKECQKAVSLVEGLYQGRLQSRILRFLEGIDSSVWRFEVSHICPTDPNSESVELDMQVFDGLGNAIDFEILPFEDYESLDEKLGCIVSHSIFSLKIAADQNYFFIVIKDKNGLFEKTFCSVDGRFCNVKKNETRVFMQDACADEDNYRRWLELHRSSAEALHLQSQKRFDHMPLFSLVVPCFESDPDFLLQCVKSVAAQSYQNWELILVDGSPETGVVQDVVASLKDERVRYLDLSENLGIVGNTNVGIDASRGDWVAFLDHDDILESDALYYYAQQINDTSDVELLFCDEDVFEKPGAYKWPVFKSELNLDLLYSYNCVTHFLAIKREMIDRIGLSQNDVAGAQDYDLTLRAVAAGAKVCHVPRMLYHWRQHEGSTSGDNLESKPYAEEAGRIALQRHFDIRGIVGEVECTEHPFIYRMRYALSAVEPLVSVVIPNKDHIGELDACIRSILTKSTYRNFEIVVVENNSEDGATFEYYEQIQSEFDQMRVIEWGGEFNYSAIVNFGVAHSDGERILLLNNDTEVISPDFISEMMGYLERPEVGVVGAKLYFRDGLVQHAGIEVGPFDRIVHVNQDFTREREGYRGRATRPGNFSAVTGACQMVRRDVWDDVGGYDEAFAVGFNDADFCLRAWDKGYRTIFTPYAELYHYEFTSRGREEVDSEKMVRWERERDLFHERWKRIFEDGDPFSNPNLKRDSAYYALPEVAKSHN